jgi:serine/threonine-protein kinase RsbW
VHAKASLLRTEAEALRERADQVLQGLAASLLEIESWPPRSPDRLRLQLPRHPVSVPLTRHGLCRWLVQFPLSPGELRDLGLAVSEACANAVEHTQRPWRQVVELEARLDAADLVLSVHAYGGWREAHGASAEHGRGLALMRSVLDTVEIASSPDGTHTQLRRRLPKRS